MDRHDDQIVVRIEGLRKEFNGVQVLKGVDLSIRAGEVAFIIGPSGGGKSTLLRCMNFLETPTGGTIKFRGEALCHEENGSIRIKPESAIRQARAKMPMVFQHFNLFNHRNVLQNVIEGPVRVLKQDREKAIGEAQEILRSLGLSAEMEKYPAQLSGGQKQRVAIARALAMDPEVILFDEPTSALDPELVSGVLETIRVLAQKGRTMVVVSHEMGFARSLADQVYFVADGVVRESGPPDHLFNNPQTDQLKRFMSSILR
ncbi:amino acid ABC transporter ATP-binding protein [Pseudaminobacter arsenicus]|uniref:Amino acid ABC transporter ATP-binding protein n=1 Tax=Borborobacter arsenicus TaxID=1851146 RepID=A0A432VBJ8_9HYPH|nr:amino acid ABC transporter ATP-binding protein [Pseudaminobacter arsenicus]RUM99538.1 amino acid ABC transporter ATP-binding protein [Pseudaminobacter arsenicus]